MTLASADGLGRPFAGLGKFATLSADPSWPYRDLGHTRAITRQYSILSVKQIAALPVSEIAARDAVLFLWIPAPLLPDGLTVMQRWASGTSRTSSGTNFRRKSWQHGAAASWAWATTAGFNMSTC